MQLFLTAMKALYKFLSTYILLLHHSEGFSCPKWTNTAADPGKPLILTPLIEQGKIEEAQEASRVKYDDFKQHQGYSGFFTVNKTFDSNMFFWYFTSQTNPRDAPVLVWLQGGPGVTSLYGLFFENGPLSLSPAGELGFRKFSWTENHHVVYFDNPVGTGFSFTKTGGLVKDEDGVGEELYEAVVQFLQLFPHLQKNEFYVAGESYAGKYVPAISYAIHSRRASAKLKINLKGLAIGNGMTDLQHQLNYADFLYQIGFIDGNLRDKTKRDEELRAKYIEEKQWDKANTLNYIPCCGPVSSYNFLDNDDGFGDLNLVGQYVEKKDVRAALHVGSKPFEAWRNVGLEDDFKKSVIPWLSELLSHYRVMTYNGQLDIMVPYVLTENYLQHLKFSGDQQYKTTKRHRWFVRDKLTGYVKKAGNLTEVMVRNAGHMVPKDQPEWAFDLITKFTHNELF